MFGRSGVQWVMKKEVKAKIKKHNMEGTWSQQFQQKFHHLFQSSQKAWNISQSGKGKGKIKVNL